jgi:hypothetical protein
MDKNASLMAYVSACRYPKIRTGFREVSKYLPILSAVAACVADPALFEWDVFLTTGNDFKTSIRTDEVYAAHPMKEKLLLEGFPKYLWRCILRLDGKPFLEMLLDTTAMVAAFPISHFWWHDDKARAGVNTVFAHKGIEATLIQAFGPRLFEVLQKACQP